MFPDFLISFPKEETSTTKIPSPCERRVDSSCLVLNTGRQAVRTPTKKTQHKTAHTGQIKQFLDDKAGRQRQLCKSEYKKWGAQEREGTHTHRASVHQPVRLLLAIQRIPISFVPLLSSPKTKQRLCSGPAALHIFRSKVTSILDDLDLFPHLLKECTCSFHKDSKHRSTTRYHSRYHSRYRSNMCGLIQSWMVYPRNFPTSQLGEVPCLLGSLMACLSLLSMKGEARRGR